MKKIFIVLLLAITIVAGFVFLLRRSTPKIVVTPENALIDKPVEIVISNLPVNAQITIEASCKDNNNNNAWIAQATFQAGDNGVVNVAKQAPISGTYKGVDPMGLFWSMVPASKDPSKNTYTSRLNLNLCKVFLSVFLGNTLLTQKIMYRSHVSPDIERKDIREQGIVGTLFHSKSREKNPGIITISGSGCGIPEFISHLLASHGYTVLALAYSGEEGLPQKLSLIPLEYFQNALRWLKKQPSVDGNKIAIMGKSRGAELVLLLASLFPGQMDAVIAYAGSHLVYDDYSPEKTSPWTYKNKPLPYMPYLSNEELIEAVKEGLLVHHKGTIEDPFENSPFFLYTMKKLSNSVKEALIRVENIRCPILILSGEDDKLLPSAVSGNSIIERLNVYGSTIKRKHIAYPDAGHNFIAVPYCPSLDVPSYIGSVWIRYGGTTEGNAHAQKESWRETLNFLEQNLKKL